jgi:DNA-binding Xre family transcriptional regulator
MRFICTRGDIAPRRANVRRMPQHACVSLTGRRVVRYGRCIFSNRGAPMKTKLSKILYDKGWTEMELSRRTGLAQSYINRVKNSRVVPTVRTALRICRALDVAVEEAFVYEDKPYGVTHSPWFPTAQALEPVVAEE